MGKRSDFERIPKDFYPTWDPNAIPKTFTDLIRGKRYAEPCCGEGDLVDLLTEFAVCRWESDIVDRGAGILYDGLCLTKENLKGCDLIITNPPYKRDILLPLIDHFTSLKPTWLLLPADFMHNKYFSPYMRTCEIVVSIGRLKWIRDSKHTSTENYCWYGWPKVYDWSEGANPITTYFLPREP